VDFSDISADAMDLSTALASDFEVPEISLLHVYRVPTG
jgi:hypothetical protein